MGIFERLFGGDASSSPSQSSDPAPLTEPGYRMWSSGGYWVCSHSGCSKKVAENIGDHDCCGRCQNGRACHTLAINNYSGPGSFYHRYSETPLRPGVCMVCGELPEVH